MNWFLEHAWIIPLIPAVSFGLILLVGKRLPKGGSEIGVASIGSSFVLSVLPGIAWIQRVNGGGDGGGGEGGEHALGLMARAAEGGEHAIEPIVRSVTWFQFGGHEFPVGTMVDGLSVIMLITVTLVSLLVHVYSTEYLKGDRRFTHQHLPVVHARMHDHRAR